MNKDIVSIYRNNKDVCLDFYDYLMASVSTGVKLELSQAMVKLMDSERKNDDQ
jgi:hypothetical protein